MARLRRLCFLFVPVALGILTAALPGRAQDGSSSRYAFSDTTLLRDTLDLRFTRLFPLADSLQIPPDTLRALSVRYLLSLERLVHLADSLGVPVDSAGPVMLRERFNPLAAGGGKHNEFTYNSSYSIERAVSIWRNAGDYVFQAGPVFMRNSTSIQMDRRREGNYLSLGQTRVSATELGWRFSPDFSLGGRVNVERMDTPDPRTKSNVVGTKNEYQLSMRSKQQPLRGLASDFNLLAGFLDRQQVDLETRGVSGNASSRLRYNAGSWLTHELNTTVDGNLARNRQPGSLATEPNRDFSRNLRGSLTLFQSATVSAKSNYSLVNGQKTSATPGSQTVVRGFTNNWSADAAVRVRQDQDRYVDLSVRNGLARVRSLGELPGRTRREDSEFRASGRYLLRGWILESSFRNGFSRSGGVSTQRDTSGAIERPFGSLDHSRSLDGSLIKQLTRSILAKVSASISLSSLRYDEGDPGTDRDSWRQSWRFDGTYAPSSAANMAIALDVSKNRLINISGDFSDRNLDTRSYQAEWRWTYRLFSSLTANQRNTLSATYGDYPAKPQVNTLTLGYGVVTTLNALVTPKLTIGVNHSSRRQPSGLYTLFPDMNYYYSPSQEYRSDDLTTPITYQPWPALALSLQPRYSTSRNAGTSNGVEVPQSAKELLDLSGGADINLHVGRKGLLRGNIRRSYNVRAATNYPSGVPVRTVSRPEDFWNGSLQLSWTL